MIGQLSLVAVLWSCVKATDTGNSLYSILPSNSPLFDQGLVGSVPQVQTINMPSSKPGQLLSFTPDGGIGNGAQMAMSPITLQPPGSTQYANTCDLSEKKEQFKKCLSDQLGKFKNILENCRKALGENAKECCIDEKCLDLLNGGNSSCNGEDGEKACKDKKCRDRIADEIMNNLNMDQLKKSLLDSLKGSLKKIGNKLGSLTSCSRGGENCDEEEPNSAPPNLSSLGLGKDVPSGVLIYPMEQSKYEAITNILDRREKFPRQGSAEQPEVQGNPRGPHEKDPAEDWNRQHLPKRRGRRSRKARLRNRESEDWSEREESSGSWRADHDGPSPRPRSSRSPGMPCTREMCADMDRYDSPAIGEECAKYCKDYRRKDIKKSDDEGKEEISELTSDSCYDEKK
ncbi:hypothetical protein [Encephalitozoon cuniculi GB-M1]|uniref:Uncharacterized protein n=2 Tax=Encephalitozoon cuniculi TaxID=6035 RepID=Q8SWJ8_ENCCU|nr:uncharacterized protein ECU01_1070 [Encephalitozoon cuniculi GB-M1]AGE96038.1 hypothetical protein ECU01_1070 [Encephalitozoon cuniculi]CAD24978.1 hypothetical protein [Encephalitozoon cuniculi GB-M1]